MGIDIYATWRGMSAAETEAQITGFSAEHGHVGYLREAYHGEPYATRVLVPEAFEDEGAEIPATRLRERLPAALEAVEQRERVIYGAADPLEMQLVMESFRNFVALCESKERETGVPCHIRASY